MLFEYNSREFCMFANFYSVVHFSVPFLSFTLIGVSVYEIESERKCFALTVLTKVLMKIRRKRMKTNFSKCMENTIISKMYETVKWRISLHSDALYVDNTTKFKNWAWRTQHNTHAERGNTNCVYVCTSEGAGWRDSKQQRMYVCFRSYYKIHKCIFVSIRKYRLRLCKIKCLMAYTSQDSSYFKIIFNC